MNILKSLIVWLCFIPVAIINGGLREIRIGPNDWWKMGIAHKRNHTKRMYLTTNMVTPSSNNKSPYFFQRLLANGDMLDRFNNNV